ncbi:hypothetical protein FKR81_40530 [Lentzea tibetensis]|uniref:Uncharacterized protein n=1 Tax=Lentzea tibetensis TaxID=2591470 RepID=A0A563EG10_9PSEU|nr:DUF5336 domain-containing protein [Lentzea tibetensis]TWP44891.1 hypothetical protein FKR81_40530 [Lentzea tibetensis]
MSVPYGAPQQQPPAGPAQQPAAGLDLAKILPLVAAGLGLISYLLAFADDVPSGQVTFLLAAGILAGLTALPKAPKALLYPAVVLAGVQALDVLQSLIKAPSVQGMHIVLLIVALLETAAVVMTLLLDAGIVKFDPKPANPYAQGQPGGWNPQSGAFPQQGQQAPGQQQFGQPQQPPQQFGQQPVQPQQPGQPPQQTSFMPQPGQFGQPGTPPGGFGGPQS